MGGELDVLYAINAVVFAIGFSMPAVINYKKLSRVNSWEKRGGIGWLQAVVWRFLRSLKLVKDDYDEAVRRTWDDRVKKLYPKISKALFSSSLLAMYAFAFFAPGFYDAAVSRYFLVALTAETVALYYRMDAGFDEDEEFEHFGRRFYMYYPFFDERKDLARSKQMFGNGTTLTVKGNALQAKFKATLMTSLFHVAAWSAFLAFVIVIGAKFGDLIWWQKLGLSVFPLLMTHTNRGGTALLDALQQYVFMATTRLPIKSFKSGWTSLDIGAWAERTIPGSKLQKPHYNIANSYFPPLSGFIHREVYKPLRTKYNMKISDAMFLTTLARGGLFIGTFAFLETWKDPEIELIGFALYYLFTATYLKRREDLSLPGFNGDKLGRRKDVIEAEWTAFVVEHTVVETACVTIPMLTHVCSKYGVDQSLK